METNEFNFGSSIQDTKLQTQPHFEKTDISAETKIPVNEEVVSKIVDSHDVEKMETDKPEENNDVIESQHVQPTPSQNNVQTSDVHNNSHSTHVHNDTNVLNDSHSTNVNQNEVHNDSHHISPIKQSEAVENNIEQHVVENNCSTEHNDEMEQNNEMEPKVEEEPKVETEDKAEIEPKIEAEHNVENETTPKIEESNEAMDEDKPEIKDEEKPQTNDEMDNVVNHYEEGETRVQEHHDVAGEEKVEESTTIPVIEEPGDAQETSQNDHQDNVEISDVTEKEQAAVKEEEEEEVKELDVNEEERIIENINSIFQCLNDYGSSIPESQSDSTYTPPKLDVAKIKHCMSLLEDIKNCTMRVYRFTRFLQDALASCTQNCSKKNNKKKGHGSKKGEAASETNTPKATKSSGKASKGSAKAKKSVDSDIDLLEEVNLKDIKGLAVFAKWPNSGWFYPGVVRDLSLSDWKSCHNENLTVTFYDGLERDMKSINIFPAELIPTNSTLFDLDEETDLTVTSLQQEGSWVKYSVKSADVSEEIVKDFDKMAIKGVFMKNIKQNYESKAEAGKGETLVSGRRARGKSSMFNEDYVSSSSPRTAEKRKSSSKDEEGSGESTPSGSSTKRRQVNGTKSTPRRASRK